MNRPSFVHRLSRERCNEMWHDPIVEEIHRTRDEQAKKYGYNLHALCKVVSRAPRMPTIHHAA